MEKDDLFYHYCSNEAFCSIINSKTIRLSSLSLSNDKTEGKLASKIFKDLAEEESVKMDDLVDYIKGAEENCHALGFCLSARDDLLSQWRGYADNAFGVAIGLSKEYLTKFAIQQELCYSSSLGSFAQVEYDYKKQKKLMRPVYEKMKELATQGGTEPPSGYESAEENNRILDAYCELKAQTSDFLPTIFRLKGDGFAEEQEWRIFVQLDERDLAGYGCKFRAAGDKLVPYRDFSFDCLGIREIILGPRNMNSEQMVTSFLNSKEIWGAGVRRSKIPYC